MTKRSNPLRRATSPRGSLVRAKSRLRRYFVRASRAMSVVGAAASAATSEETSAAAGGLRGTAGTSFRPPGCQGRNLRKRPAMPRTRPIRYAVVGLGYISQVAMLPAFAHARRNSRLAALVSGDAAKLRALGERHGVARRVHYDDFEELAASGEIDAVYVGLPNTLHRD